MLTEFGKYLRKVRIDHDEILSDMAQRLGVSASFLSSVEVGKKNVPEKWPDLIADEYKLPVCDRRKLHELAKESVKTVKIELAGTSSPRRTAALTFARDFGSIPDETAEQIIRLINETARRKRG